MVVWSVRLGPSGCSQLCLRPKSTEITPQERLTVKMPPKMDASAAAFGGSFPSMPRTYPSHGSRRPPCLAWAEPQFIWLPASVLEIEVPKTVSLPSRNSRPQDNNGTPSVPPRILGRPLFFYLPLSSSPEQTVPTSVAQTTQHLLFHQQAL